MNQFRTALLTFTIGILSVQSLSPLYDKWSEPFVDVPVVESKSPITVISPTKRKPFRIDVGAGGGGSGGQTCEDFIKSLGKLTKQSRRILADTPCGKVIPKE